MAVDLAARAFRADWTFLASGISKVANFSGGVAEMAEAGLPVPAALALLSVFVELTGSILVLSNRWV
jgi:transmembrane protein